MKQEPERYPATLKQCKTERLFQGCDYYIEEQVDMSIGKVHKKRDVFAKKERKNIGKNGTKNKNQLKIYLLRQKVVFFLKIGTSGERKEYKPCYNLKEKNRKKAGKIKILCRMTE